MADSSGDESDFSGFNDQDIDISEERQLQFIVRNADEDFSDVEISDFELDEELTADEPETDVLEDGGQWTENLTHSVKFAFSGPEPGPTVTLGEDKREEDFLKLFLTDDILNILVVESNRYAEQRQELKGHDKRWRPVSKMISFIFFLTNYCRTRSI